MFCANITQFVKIPLFTHRQKEKGRMGEGLYMRYTQQHVFQSCTHNILVYAD